MMTTVESSAPFSGFPFAASSRIVRDLDLAKADFENPTAEYGEDLDAFTADIPKKCFAEQGPVLLLARHGLAFGNAERCFQGKSYSPLVPVGFQQADHLGERLQPFQLGATIYCSPLERSLRTATRARDHAGSTAEIIQLQDLVEVDPGILDLRFKKRSSQEIDGFFEQIKDVGTRADYKNKYGLRDDELDLILKQMQDNRKILQTYARLAQLSEDDYVKYLQKQGKKHINFAIPNGESLESAKIDRAHRVKENIYDRLAPGYHFVTSHGLNIRLQILELLGIDLKSRDQAFGFEQGNACLNVLWRPKKDWKLLVLNSPTVIPGDVSTQDVD